MKYKIMNRSTAIAAVIAFSIIGLFVFSPAFDFKGSEITGLFVLDEPSVDNETAVEPIPEPIPEPTIDETDLSPPQKEEETEGEILFTVQETYIERIYPIVHANSVHSASGALNSQQISDISSDDAAFVTLSKGETITVELEDTANSIDTLNDVNCTVIYYTDASYKTDAAQFIAYDSQGGTAVDTLQLTTPSTVDLTRHVVDLETKGLTALEVSTMQLYVVNQISTKPYSIYVDALWCDIDYDYSAPADYPVFSGYGTNASQAKASETVKFNLTITDPTTSVSYANGSVGGQVVDFTANGDEWYYEHICTDAASGTVSWITISANDTDNNWNSTSVSQSYSCDGIVPSISDPSANETNIEPTNYFCINATITDDGPASVDTVYGEIWNTTDHYNISLSNSAGVCNAGGDVYAAQIQVTQEGTWQYGKVWANDSYGNINVSDFTDINIEVRDYPQFSDYYVNDTLLANGEIAKFNVSIISTNGVSYANATINGNNVNLVFGSGTEWYYEYTCSGSDSDVGFTYVAANDSINSWNETSVAGITTECDANAPESNNEQMNESSIEPNDYFCIASTVTDAEGNLVAGSVEAQIWNTTNYINISMTNDGSSCGSGGDVYGAQIQATAEGIWNFTYVFASDTAGNKLGKSLIGLNVSVGYDYSIQNVVVNWPFDNAEFFTGEHFDFNCTPDTSGAETGISLTYQYQIVGVLSWTDISTTGNLTTTESNPIGNVLDGTSYRLDTLANDNSTNIELRCKLSNSTTDIFSTAVPIKANADYPQFFDYYVNDTLLANGENARFNLSVTGWKEIQTVNGTINGQTATFTQLGSTDEWYYDYSCSSSDLNVDWTYVWAENKVNNENSTTVSGVSLECDAAAPDISGELTTPLLPLDNEEAELSAQISDTEGNLDQVWIGGNWSGNWQNYTSGITNVLFAYYYNVSSDQLEGGEVVGWRYYANDTAGNTFIGALQQFTVLTSAYLNMENITIAPDDADPNIIVNPVENNNKTVNVTVTFKNSTEIDLCTVKIFNSTDSYEDPTFEYFGTIDNCAGVYCDCFAEWDMEYWRNPGTWNVSVDINMTNAYENKTSELFTYNELKSINISVMTIAFSAVPEETTNSTNAYPLTVKNIGNVLANVSINGSNFVGASQSQYIINVENASYDTTELGTYTELTHTSTKVLTDMAPASENSIYFRASFPIGFIEQIYENTIEFLT